MKYDKVMFIFAVESVKLSTVTDAARCFRQKLTTSHICEHSCREGKKPLLVTLKVSKEVVIEVLTFYLFLDM